MRSDSTVSDVKDCIAIAGLHTGVVVSYGLGKKGDGEVATDVERVDFIHKKQRSSYRHGTGAFHSQEAEK
jgi:hypothetical protein